MAHLPEIAGWPPATVGGAAERLKTALVDCHPAHYLNKTVVAAMLGINGTQLGNALNVAKRNPAVDALDDFEERMTYGSEGKRCRFLAFALC